MGPNSSRSLTYLLVLGAVGALIYAVYNTNKSRNRLKSPAYDSATGNTNVSSTDTSLLLSSPAALKVEAGRQQVANTLGSAAAGTAAAASELASYSTEKVKKAVSNSPEIISTEDPSLVDKSLLGSDPIASSAKTKMRSKSVKKHSVKKHKFDAGAVKGDFMVVAGNFASKDNADAQVAKLKKIGFAKAEVVKLDNSATLHVIAGNYSYKGGADAALRTLKAHKVAAFVKKKSGDIYKASNPTPAPAAKSQPS